MSSTNSTNLDQNRKFVSITGGKVIYCDEVVLVHSDIFKTLFEIGDDPIKITRDFGLFEKVIEFARDPSPARRYNVLKDEATRDLIVTELDIYGIMGPDDSRVYLQVETHIVDVALKRESLVDQLKYDRVDHSGFIHAYEKILTRKDIDPLEKRLVLNVLVAQAQLYYETMYRKMHNTVYAQAQYVQWFKDPNCFGRTIDAKYKLPKAYKRSAWMQLDMHTLLNTKDEMMAGIEREFPREVFRTDGIDRLFNCTVAYKHPVDLVSLMRAVIHHVSSRLKLCAKMSKKKAHINMIRKYLDNPCKTVLGRN